MQISELTDALEKKEAELEEMEEALNDRVDELVITKVVLAEQKGKNEEFKHDSSTLKRKLANAAARYTKLEAMYASMQNIKK